MQHPCHNEPKKNRTRTIFTNTNIPEPMFVGANKGVQNVSALQTIYIWVVDLLVCYLEFRLQPQTTWCQTVVDPNCFDPKEEHFWQHLLISHWVNNHQLKKNLNYCKKTCCWFTENSCLKIYHFSEAFWQLINFCSFVINGKKLELFFQCLQVDMDEFLDNQQVSNNKTLMTTTDVNRVPTLF